VSVLDAFADLARKRWVLVLAGVLVAVAVLGPAFLGGDDGDDEAGEGPDATATTTAAETTAPSATTLAPPPASGPTAEVDREGDDPNPGERYPGRPDVRQRDQEREVGGEPARLSGFSVWLTAVEHLAEGPPGAPEGPWVRASVRLVNRDEGGQAYAFEDWSLVDVDGIAAEPAFASAAFVTGEPLPGHAEVQGELWFRRTREGPHWVVFRPQQDSARAVWAVPPEPS